MKTKSSEDALEDVLKTPPSILKSYHLKRISWGFDYANLTVTTLKYLRFDEPSHKSQ